MGLRKVYQARCWAFPGGRGRDGAGHVVSQFAEPPHACVPLCVGAEVPHVVHHTALLVQQSVERFHPDR